MTFYLNRNVNKQNFRYCLEENPHLFRKGHTQYSQKIYVWTDTLGDAIIVTLFIQGNFDGEMYADMLQRSIESLIGHELENQIYTEIYL